VLLSRACENIFYVFLRTDVAVKIIGMEQYVDRQSYVNMYTIALSCGGFSVPIYHVQCRMLLVLLQENVITDSLVVAHNGATENAEPSWTTQDLENHEPNRGAEKRKTSDWVARVQDA